MSSPPITLVGYTFIGLKSTRFITRITTHKLPHSWRYQNQQIYIQHYLCHAWIDFEFLQGGGYGLVDKPINALPLLSFSCLIRDAIKITNAINYFPLIYLLQVNKGFLPLSFTVISNNSLQAMMYAKTSFDRPLSTIELFRNLSEFLI